jgi:hypothetical protein
MNRRSTRIGILFLLVWGAVMTHGDREARWTKAPDMLTPYPYNAAVAVQGKLYVVGGDETLATCAVCG